VIRHGETKYGKGELRKYDPVFPAIIVGGKYIQAGLSPVFIIRSWGV